MPALRLVPARLVALAVLVGLCGEVHAVSTLEERRLGQQFALTARTRLALVTDPTIVGYVNRIGQEIVARLEGAPYDYHFFVVRDGSVNAFAVPGGYVYVNSGLLVRAANDDELAGVLGHEIAHIHAHHMARQQEATQWANYASLIGTILSAVQPAIGAVATGASAAVQLAYRREFEQEADYMGARYSRAAGFDAQGILDFFKKLADEQRHSPTLVPPYLLSHPLTDERLNHLEAVLRTKQWSGRERRPRSLELAYVQALTEAQSSRPAEVVAAYRGMADADPGNAAARYLYGVVCLETGQYDCARRALEEAQAAGLGAADRDLGRLALRSREVDRAVPLLRSAVEQNPDDAGAHAELAKALELAGDREGAIGCYERAIEASPDLEDAHHALGLMLGRSGREAEGFYHLATALRLRGDYEQALNQYVRAERALPGSDARAAETRDYVRVLSAFLRVPNPVRGDAGGLAPDAR